MPHREITSASLSFSGCPLNRNNSTAGQYAQACVQVASECGAVALDLWTLMQEDGQVGDCYTAACPERPLKNCECADELGKKDLSLLDI